MRPDYLVVGLGNPGKKYKKTRHNIGFMICDYIASFFDLKFRFGAGNSKVSLWQLDQIVTAVAKPLTYMNNSGIAVSALLEEFKLNPNKLLVVVDDYNLSLGTIRIRPSGSSGGHNGLQSIIDRIHTNLFPRLRVGIAGENTIEDSVEYVLSNFRKSELRFVKKIIPVSVEAIRSWLFEGIDTTMSHFNKNHIISDEVNGGG